MLLMFAVKQNKDEEKYYATAFSRKTNSILLQMNKGVVLRLQRLA